MGSSCGTELPKINVVSAVAVAVVAVAVAVVLLVVVVLVLVLVLVVVVVVVEHIERNKWENMEFLGKYHAEQDTKDRSKGAVAFRILKSFPGRSWCFF